MSLVIVLVVTLLGSSCDVLAETVSYCVQPDNDTQVDCHPFSYYVGNQSVLQNNSQFCFLHGDYELHRVWFIESNITLSNLSFVSPCGKESLLYAPSAIVTCNTNQSGLVIRNVYNITIIGLEFNNCGHNSINSYHHDLKLIVSALLLVNVQNLVMSGVTINNSSGWGMYCYSLAGNSIITHSVFSGGHKIANHSGGNLRLKFEESQVNYTATNVTIEHTIITGGSENSTDNRSYAGGLDVYLDTKNIIKIVLYNVFFYDNSGYDGGNIALTYTTHDSWWKSSITISSCVISGGKAANYGGGLYMEAIQAKGTPYKDTTLNSPPILLEILNTKFSNNIANHSGGGIYLQIHESQNLTSKAKITIVSCNFTNNTVNSSQSGTALHLVNYHLPGSVAHTVPQYLVIINDSKFSENGFNKDVESSLGCGTVYIADNAETEIYDSQFIQNECSGIVAIQSTLVFYGLINITENKAYNGGGLMLCANSIMYMTNEVDVYIENNFAKNFGGGIYAEFECAQEIAPCFYGTEMNRTSVYVVNNTATAGDAVFGGSIDYCYTLPNSYLSKHHHRAFFGDVFYIGDSPHDHSKIASDPYKVCFCNDSGFDPGHCKTTFTYQEPQLFYPGMNVMVHVVIVGQRNGIVPGVVQASLNNSNFYIPIKSYEVNQECKRLTYIISKNGTMSKGEQMVHINLTVENALFRTRSPNQLSSSPIKVNVQNSCPSGFNLNNDDNNICVCSNRLMSALKGLQMRDCNITTNSITRRKGVNWWMGFKNNTIIYSHYCPFDFCTNVKEVTISFLPHNNSDISTSDTQCSFKRTGTLCGSCPPNHTHILGSPSCKKCKTTALKVIGKTIMFAVLGILLLLFLGLLNLNVTVGTLNPIIFYMNIVRINSSIYFGMCEGVESCKSREVMFLRQFVAWMNLDFGIGLCYYDKMTSIGKTGLQFVFPLYLWCLCGIYIYLNRKISLISRLAGKQSIRLLATVILLSYAKLLHTIIDILWPVTLYNFETRYHIKVWKMDGTQEYFKNSHQCLCILAGIVGLVTLPYTLSLLFIQLLNRASHYKVLFWVVKLKPFFDAYTGPYKDRYQFWTGFLLVVRIFMFIAIADNTTKGPVLNLSIVGCAAAILLILSKNGAYKSVAISIIESFIYLNLILFSIITAYQFQQKSAGKQIIYEPFDNNRAIILFVGSMLVLFCGVVVFNFLKMISATKYWGQCKIWARETFWHLKRRKPIKSLILHHSFSDSDSSSSDGEMDPLHNAPLPARYDQLREPLVETH